MFTERGPGMRDDDEADEEEPLEAEAEVACPSCGEAVSITLDPGGGTDQTYVEDCEVCCRPWVVHVTYDRTGKSNVWIESAHD